MDHSMIIDITKVSTGETRQHIAYDWDHRTEFLWTEGNYSCDCNRALLFARLRNEDETEAWEQECGEKAYIINIRN